VLLSVVVDLAVGGAAPEAGAPDMAVCGIRIEAKKNTRDSKSG
jgi:hypothetical protein